MNDEKMQDLLDELFCTLLNLRHFYDGIRDEISKDLYTVEQARRDLETLTHSEKYGDVLAILGDIVALLPSDATEDKITA